MRSFAPCIKHSITICRPTVIFFLFIGKGDMEIPGINQAREADNS